MERLELVGRRGQPHGFGRGDRMREAADVMAAERRPQPLVIRQQEPRAPLERRVALPLLQVDRLRPTQPPRAQDLVIPVRPLDQSDRDRRPARIDPVAQHPQLGFGLRLVGLDHDADVGPVAELGLDEHPAEQLVGQGTVGVLLHVNVDIGSAIAGGAEDRPEPAGGAVDRRLGVDRLEVGRQARQLEREVDPGDRPVLVAVDQRDFGGLRQRAGQLVDHRQAGALVPVGLGLADDGFAEQVGRERELPPTQTQHRLHGLVGRGPGDELPGHDAGGRAGRNGQPFLAGRARGRQLQGEIQPPRHRVGGLVEILGQVPADRSGVLEGRQGVDEPEELDPDQRVVQGHRHEAVVPPRSPPGPALAGDPVEQLAADLAGPAVKSVRATELAIGRRRPAVAGGAIGTPGRNPVRPRILPGLRSGRHRRWSSVGNGSLGKRFPSILRPRTAACNFGTGPLPGRTSGCSDPHRPDRPAVVGSRMFHARPMPRQAEVRR